MFKIVLMDSLKTTCDLGGNKYAIESIESDQNTSLDDHLTSNI